MLILPRSSVSFFIYYYRGKIIEKEYGKSKVYFADQDQFPVVDEAEMKQMDIDIENLAEELNDLKTSIDSLRSSMIDLID